MYPSAARMRSQMVIRLLIVQIARPYQSKLCTLACFSRGGEFTALGFNIVYPLAAASRESAAYYRVLLGCCRPHGRCY
jgi:hypothetical protein